MAKKVLVFAGSARAKSWNKQLARAGAKALEAAGASVTLVDLADHPAPIFNEDEEAASGMPASMAAFKSLMAQHDGYMISTPEYNGAVPALLVNTFHWMSRAAPGEAPHGAYFGKPVALLATSPGGLGGIRVLPRLRDMLGDLGIYAVSGVVSVPQAPKAFNEQGELIDPTRIEQLQGLAQRLVAAL